MKISILFAAILSLAISLQCSATCSLQSGTRFSVSANSNLVPNLIAFSPSGAYLATGNSITMVVLIAP